MTKPTRPYRRRQWLVDRPLQLRFVRAILLVVLVMGATAALGTYGALWFTLYSFELLKEAYIKALFSTILWTIVLELVVLIPLVSWLGIFLTHRVGGPLVRIRAALSQMAKGDFDIHLQLRKGDALTDLADDINRLAAFLRRRTPS